MFITRLLRNRLMVASIAATVLAIQPAACMAATVTWDVVVRSVDVPSAGNPQGIYPGLIVAGNVGNPDTALDQEIRIERSISNPTVGTGLNARVAWVDGQLRAQATGFWAASYSDTAEPSQAATALIRVRDSFVIAGPGPALSLNIGVHLDGGILANNGNASWYMGAFLAQGLIGSNPGNVFDYATLSWVVTQPIDPIFGPHNPYGILDHGEGASGDINASTYYTAPTTIGVFERGVPIEVFWFLRTDIDDRNTAIPSPGSASGNFYSTATWLGITARDAEGNIVEGLEAIGPSGYDWRVGEANPVPVPASIWLLLAGLGLATARCRHRSSS